MRTAPYTTVLLKNLWFLHVLKCDRTGYSDWVGNLNIYLFIWFGLNGLKLLLLLIIIIIILEYYFNLSTTVNK